MLGFSTAVAFPTDLIAAVVGGLLGFMGAIWASSTQSRRDERRALRSELTHLAVAFIESGDEIAWLNKEMEHARRDPAISRDERRAITEKRNAVEDEMRKTVQFIRIGYPQLADAATEFYRSLSQTDLPLDEREHVDLVYVELLPVEKRRFEMAVRLALGGKKPRHWRAELTLNELIFMGTLDEADGKRPKWSTRVVTWCKRLTVTGRTGLRRKRGEPLVPPALNESITVAARDEAQ